MRHCEERDPSTRLGAGCAIPLRFLAEFTLNEVNVLAMTVLFADGNSGSGDLEPLRTKVFVFTHWTARRIVELRPILEAVAATLVGRWADLETGGSGDRAGDMLEVVDDDLLDRKSTRLNSSHIQKSRMPSSA